MMMKITQIDLDISENGNPLYFDLDEDDVQRDIVVFAALYHTVDSACL